MIRIYVEGSKKLGLGHLSRIVPIYHSFLDKGHEIEVYFFGDDIGSSYLNLHSVHFQNTDSMIFFEDEVQEQDLWIVDATNIHTTVFKNLIINTGIKILLSPKFNNELVYVFDACIIRSDPFNLDISNKIVDPYVFPLNRGQYYFTKGDLKYQEAIQGQICPKSAHL